MVSSRGVRTLGRPRYPHRDLVAALAISVEALDPADRERYHDLAVFPEDTPIPEEALRALWRRDGLDDAGVERLAELFVDRSLAQWDKTGRLVLHDLQADYARARAVDLARRHKKLTDGYASLAGGEWSAGPDDGYYFQRLPWHLAQAGEAGALRDLLFDFRWLSAKLGAVGPALLPSDYDELVIDGEQGVLMADTLRLSSHVLAGKVASSIGSFLALKRTWVACASLPASCWLSKLMQRCMRHATPVRCTSGCLNRRG